MSATPTPDTAGWAPRASALLCLLMAALLVAGLYHWTVGFERWTFESRRHWQIGQQRLQAAPVALIDSRGEPLPAWGTNTAAQAYLVDFIYTRCPSVCQALGSHYQQMQRQMRERADAAGVRLLSVSIDRAHDTPAELARYARTHQADARWWWLGAPASDAESDALLRALGVVVVPDGLGGFNHNGAIHLIDADGRLRGLFDFEQWPRALNAAIALNRRGTGA
ncbi:MAG: SCO family protein [Pseudomonadota bacterium]|nr:SCO family protein [Pseudomonadota bacterium]